MTNNEFNLFELAESIQGIGGKTYHHQVNGMVFKPAEDGMRSIVIVDAKADDNSEHVSGYRVNVYQAERVLVNRPYSKAASNGRTAWVVTNIDDGLVIEADEKIKPSEMDEILRGVRNNNANQLHLFQNNAVFNSLVLMEATLSEFTVCPSQEVPQSMYDKLNKLGLQVFTLYKYWDQFAQGKAYWSYATGAPGIQENKRDHKKMITQFAHTLNEYNKEYARLVEVGALMTSACLYAGNNSLYAVTRAVKGLRIGSNTNHAFNPNGFGTPNSTACLHITGEAYIHAEMEHDPLHSQYDTGIGNTSREEGQYGTQRTRYMVEVTARNGQPVLARSVIFGNNSVGRGQMSRPEIMAQAVANGNNVIIYRNDNVLTFESLFEREDDNSSEAWCVRPAITVNNYTLAKDDMSLDALGAAEEIIAPEDVDSPIDEEVAINIFQMVTPKDAVNRHTSESGNAVAQARKQRIDAMANRGKAQEPTEEAENALDANLEETDAPFQFPQD